MTTKEILLLFCVWLFVHFFEAKWNFITQIPIENYKWKSFGIPPPHTSEFIQSIIKKKLSLSPYLLVQGFIFIFFVEDYFIWIWIYWICVLFLSFFIYVFSLFFCMKNISLFKYRIHFCLCWIFFSWKICSFRASQTWPEYVW